MTDLKNEGLNDMVVMFVQLNRADDAMAYFKAHAGKKKQFQLTTRLAYQLADAGHHDNAIKTFRFMLAENAMAEQAPDFQQAIIKTYEGLRQRDNVKAEVKKLAELYRPGSTWWKANESKKEVLVNGFNVAEEAMRTIVTEYHQEAQKTKQVETYRLARDIYKQYVDGFASLGRRAFRLGPGLQPQVLLRRNSLGPRGVGAGGQAVRRSGPRSRFPTARSAKEASNESYRKSSAYNAILAYDKLVKIERGLLQKTELKENEKVEETKKKGKVEKTGEDSEAVGQGARREASPRLREEAGRRVRQLQPARYPKNADEVDIAYQAAVIYYDKNHFVEAARRFGDIINKYPEEKRSQEAADLSMAVLEEKQEWLELNKLSRQFLANKKLAKAGTDFTKRTAVVIEGSQYKYVDEVMYKKEKDPKQAAGEFLEFVAEFPKSDNADRALTYAMIISRRSGRARQSASRSASACSRNTR